MSEIYVRDVRKALDKIHGSKTGRALLEAIDRHRQWINIYPRLHGVTAKFKDRNPKPSKGGVVKNSAINVTTGLRDLLPALGVAGSGSNSNIYYLPQVLITGAQVGVADEWATPDAVLVHELVHAMRIIAGKLFDLAVDPLDVLKSGASRTPVTLWRFKNIEEFLAVLVTNIYRSEMGLPLRAAYRGSQQQRSLSRSERQEFAATHAGLIDAIMKGHPQFTRKLALVPASFNPVRDRRAARNAQASQRLLQQAGVIP